MDKIIMNIIETILIVLFATIFAGLIAEWIEWSALDVLVLWILLVLVYQNVSENS